MLIDRFVGRLFLAVGLIMLLFAGYRAYDQIVFGRIAAHAEGVVSDVVRDRRPGLNYRVVFGTVVRFQDGKGEWHQFAEPISSNPPLYQRGEIVSVLFDPAAPDEAVIDGFVGRFLMPTIFAVLGVVMLVLGRLVLSSNLFGRTSARLGQVRQASARSES